MGNFKVPEIAVRLANSSKLFKNFSKFILFILSFSVDIEKFGRYVILQIEDSKYDAKE